MSVIWLSRTHCDHGRLIEEPCDRCEASNFWRGLRYAFALAIPFWLALGFVIWRWLR